MKNPWKKILKRNEEKNKKKIEEREEHCKKVRSIIMELLLKGKINIENNELENLLYAGEHHDLMKEDEECRVKKKKHGKYAAKYLKKHYGIDKLTVILIENHSNKNIREIGELTKREVFLLLILRIADKLSKEEVITKKSLKNVLEKINLKSKEILDVMDEKLEVKNYYGFDIFLEGNIVKCREHDKKQV